MNLVGTVSSTHRCEISGCRSTTHMRIGNPNRIGSWVYICEEHLKELFDDMKEYFSEPEPVVKESLTTEPEPTVSKNETVEPEYYVCKQCGEKFRKPEQLGEYRKHIMSAHKKDKK